MTDLRTKRQLEIIGAAGRILSSSGVSGLTTKRLALEMKFSESALYRHFGSKEELIIALLEHIAKELDERYTDIRENELSPKEALRAVFQAQFDFFQENPQFAVAVFSDGLLAENTLINKAVKDIMKVKQRHLRPILEKGQESGVFKEDPNADMILQIVMGSVRLLMFKWRMADFKFDLSKKGNELIEANLLLISNTKSN